MHVYEGAAFLGLPDHLRDLVAGMPLPQPSLRGSALIALDLDRTLIYSANALSLTGPDHEAPALDVAEVYQGKPLSFITWDAELLLDALREVATVVPTTTRTPEQFTRVATLARASKLAVTSNGGTILVDGLPCPHWAAQVAGALAGCAPLEEIQAHLRAVTGDWVLKHRDADGMFAYLVVERERIPTGFVDELRAWCEQLNWRVSLQGRKIYCVPAPLTKSAALAELARRQECLALVAAGDSLLDADMLQAADLAIRPAHGELHQLGWQPGTVAVTEAQGVYAACEILARALAAVLATGT